MRLTQLRQADLNLLVVFAVMAKECNVSRAASRLLLSQPAVSRSLQRLRELFHDDLLVRTALSYEITPQGQRLMQELEVMLPRLDRLISGGEFDPMKEVARFKIGVTDYAASVFSPLLCREVLPVSPRVTLELNGWRSDRFEALATVPRRLALEYARDRRIKLLAPPEPLHSFKYVMVWHPRVNTDAAHIWLRKTIQNLGRSLALAG